MSKRPLVFIGGIERSGTTVLASALVRAFDAIAVPESQFKLLPIRSHAAAPNYVDIARHFRARLWGVEFSDTELAKISSSESLYLSFVQKLLARENVSEDSAIIDHTPHNIANSAKFFGQFKVDYYLYIYRDPRSVVSSLMKTDWGLRTLESAIAHWQKRMQEDRDGLKFLAELAPSKLRVISYEELCEAPDRAIANLSMDLLKRNVGKSFVFTPKYTTSQHKRILARPSIPREVKFAFSPREEAYVDMVSREAFFADKYTNQHRSLSSHNENLAPSPLLEAQRTLLLPIDRLKNVLRRRRRGVISQSMGQFYER